MLIDEEWQTLPLRRIPTQTRARAKVVRALEAAELLLRTDGPEAITLPRVAAAAEVSVGALYQYLPDRDAIARALTARYHARLERLLDDAVARAVRDAPPPHPVAHVIDAVAAVYGDQEPVRALHALSATPAGDEERAAHKQRMAATLALLLQASGVPAARTPDDAARTARVAFLAADAVLHDAFAASPYERGALLAELRRMLTLFLAPHTLEA